MRRADRLFQLVQVLRSRRTATGQQLADELGVSKRTVYRDIRDLEYAGVPIRGEAGVGYRLDARFELPPLTFTAQEIEGLVLGARIVQTWGDEQLASAVSSSMTKIQAVLPEPMRDVWLGTALFAGGEPRVGVSRHLAQLRRAIGDHRLLQFDYARADGTPSSRAVRPLGLYFWGNKWTLAAYCELRRDYRSFRPDRMSAVRLLEERFDPSGEISLSRFLARMEEQERGWRERTTRSPEPRGAALEGNEP
jgi:predicted DNA-binding transcriptional regulator YafY